MAAFWTALSASVRGATHEQNGRENQDAVRLHSPAMNAEPLILAVADGHGSARSFRSARGSALATECAVRLLKDFLRRHGKETSLSTMRRRMEMQWPGILLAEWHRAVRADLAKNPFTALDFAAFPEKPPVLRPGFHLPFQAYLAYGATLIFAAVTRRFLIYGQLGDGDILIVRPDGTVMRPWPREHAFFANETVSLCSDQAASAFYVRVEPLRAEAPALIMLSTDGYANCFENDEGFSQVGRDFLGYLRANGIDYVNNHLERWLRESSHDGSGDDITVGLALRLNALRARSSQERSSS